MVLEFVLTLTVYHCSLLRKNTSVVTNAGRGSTVSQSKYMLPLLKDKESRLEVNSWVQKLNCHELPTSNTS